MDDPEEQQAQGSRDEHSQITEETVKIALNISVAVSRPLSSVGKRQESRNGDRAGSSSGATDATARPRTAGASRHCDVDATCADVARRWIAAAESIDIFSDHDLAQVTESVCVGLCVCVCVHVKSIQLVFLISLYFLRIFIRR